MADRFDFRRGAQSDRALSRRDFVQGAAAVGAGALLAPAASSFAFAQDYPNRPVTIIAPAAAGGPTDIVSRAAAQRLQARFKQGVVVENRGGAAGNIGAAAAAKAEPDGYTLVTLLAPLAQNTAIYKNPGFNLDQDFKPLAHMASVDLLIIARPNLPVKNLKEFLAYTKENPGKLTCGSQSPPQMEYLKRTTKADFTVAPYRGSALITNDVIGGQIDIGLVPYSDVAQHIAAGSVRPLFTNGPKRVLQLPEVESVGETFPGFYFWSWYGLAAPSRTPQPIVDQLRGALIEIAGAPDFKQFLLQLGLAPVDAPEKFGDVITAEIAQWRRLVDELNLPRI